jgi:ATP-dependent protease HslVU (ClpYQ) peptidase subunit
MVDDYTEATYGEKIADIYDERYVKTFANDTADAVSYLKGLAARGESKNAG